MRNRYFRITKIEEFEVGDDVNNTKVTEVYKGGELSYAKFSNGKAWTQVDLNLIKSGLQVVRSLGNLRPINATVSSFNKENGCITFQLKDFEKSHQFLQKGEKVLIVDPDYTNQSVEKILGLLFVALKESDNLEVTTCNHHILIKSRIDGDISIKGESLL
jgi:hypothetical protein